MIEAKNLIKVFKDRKRGEVRAVDDVSFDCQKGEIFGLLGPNGAGKTTTLRMLSTAIKPTSGTSQIEGHDIIKEAGRVRQVIGFLSGNTGLYGRLTAREMVHYFGHLYGMRNSEVKKRTEELFDLLEMKDYADSRNDKLSTGMKQKVSIARSVVHDPPVMIFDEPTSGLDVMSSRTIVDFIKGCRDQGKCVIFSTHIMSEANRLCDKIAVIHKGRKYFEGSVDDMLQKTGQNNLEDAFIGIVEA